MRHPEYTAMMQGDDGSLGSAELIAYKHGIDDLRSAVTGMTPEEVLARPVAGKWGTQECVDHIADTEVFFTDRIVRTIALDRPLPMSADETLYIARLEYQSSDLGEQLALFAALRRHAGRSRPRPCSGPPCRASRTSSPCGSSCSRPCGTTCRSSPRSGPPWSGSRREPVERRRRVLPKHSVP